MCEVAKRAPEEGLRRFESPVKDIKWEFYRASSICLVALAVREIEGRIVLLARGLAIRSPDDREDTGEGIRWAQRRAMRAILGRDVEPIRRADTVRRMLSGGAYMFCQKSYIFPSPTLHELRTLKTRYPRHKVTVFDHGTLGFSLSNFFNRQVVGYDDED